MTRGEVRRRLAMEWWRQLALTLAPVFVFSLPQFHAYKRGLIATEKALDTPEEPAAWLELARRRRIAFLAAGLPAWIAALAVFVGLEAIPLMLLAIASLVLFYLYRIPAQLH